MECKYSGQGEVPKRRKELIDTLWNVNTNSTEKINSPAPELIDTLWNVNVFQELVQQILRRRINRYIMECK